MLHISSALVAASLAACFGRNLMVLTNLNPMYLSTEVPNIVDYQALLKAVKGEFIEDEMACFEAALAGSWACCSLYDDGELVGFGRVVSDGHLRAFVAEVMVHPRRQGRGLGSMVLRTLVALCAKAGISDIKGFSGERGASFCRRNGFELKREGIHGVQFVGM